MKWHRLITATVLGVGLLGSAMVLPAIAQLRGEVPGSFLIFPEFNISPGLVTQLRISDVSDPANGGISRIHLQYICPGVAGVCATVDVHTVTTFHGTLTLDVAAPCTRGYVVAFAEDAAHRPISANQLIGSYRIHASRKDDGEPVNAIAVQSVQAPGTVLGTIDATGDRVLSFGLLASSDYVALPSILYSDFRAVDVAAGKRTELIVLTPTIKTGSANPTANIGVDWWNQNADEHSTTQSFTCWAEFELETIDPLFTAAGLGSAYGSLKVAAVTSGTYSPTILGIIRETGPGPKPPRRMYHVGLRSTTYGLGPETSPPAPVQ